MASCTANDIAWPPRPRTPTTTTTAAGRARTSRSPTTRSTSRRRTSVGLHGRRGLRLHRPLLEWGTYAALRRRRVPYLVDNRRRLQRQHLQRPVRLRLHVPGRHRELGPVERRLHRPELRCRHQSPGRRVDLQRLGHRARRPRRPQRHCSANDEAPWALALPQPAACPARRPPPATGSSAPTAASSPSARQILRLDGIHWLSSTRVLGVAAGLAGRRSWWFGGEQTEGAFAFGGAGFVGFDPGSRHAPGGCGGLQGHLVFRVGVVALRSRARAGCRWWAADGGVFAFGDAHFAGSCCPGIGGLLPVLLCAIMPNTKRQWVLGGDQDRKRLCLRRCRLLRGTRLGTVTSTVSTPDGRERILLGDGDVYAYGDAGYLGSPPSGNFSALDDASAIFSTSDGGGYWVSSTTGKIFTFGDATTNGQCQANISTGRSSPGAGVRART